MGTDSYKQENALKGIPSHDIGIAKDVLEEAIKDGFQIPKHTGYGDHVSLNFKRRDEILSIIAEAFKGLISVILGWFARTI